MLNHWSMHAPWKQCPQWRMRVAQVTESWQIAQFVFVTPTWVSVADRICSCEG
jgi:hypothetical protein